MTVPSDGRYPGVALRTAAAYAWRILVVGALGYVVLRLLGRVMTAVIPFVVAMLLTALLRPILVWLRARGVPRLLATVLTVLVALLVLGGLITAVVLKAASQAPQLGDQINRLVPHLKTWLERGPFHVDSKSVNNFTKSLSKTISSHSSDIASAAVTTGKTVVDVVTGLVLTFFVTVFLLYDGEGVWEYCTRAFPKTVRHRVDEAGKSAWGTLSHYVRGTMVVAVYHGVVVAIVLVALGAPLVLPLSVIVALGSFVPLVGAIVCGALAVAVAGISKGLVAAIVVAIVLVIDNQVEAHVLQPFVVGRYVKIHPLATVMGLAVGALTLGIFGAIIAVPVIACINSAARSLLKSGEPERAMDPQGKAAGNPPAATEEQAPCHAGTGSAEPHRVFRRRHLGR